jgi:hypothetical protein
MEVILTSKPDLKRLIRKSVRAAVVEVLEKKETKQAEPKEWLTNKEAQDFLGLSRATLQRYRDRGTLPYSKVGGNIYYRYADVVALLEENLVDSLRRERS